MTAIAIVVAVAALILWGNDFRHKRSASPQWHPLGVAFTLTAVALLYGMGGLMGYALPAHNPFIDRPPVWVGHVVWAQVGWAAVALLASIFFWWHGIRRLSR